ncbi:MAG: 3-phosphoshikimate 1-carboxyvinyltransferase [Opitutaceae bacterium]|jgi:3-phosphoshikimate 1-carboxyvinyltransferase
MSPLPAVLPIQPFTRPVRGEVTLPGSKSLTNRALLLAALCKDKVTLTGALFSEDTHLMVEALKALGFTINANADAGTIEVSDQANGFKNEQPVDLFVGLAGTAARFLTALCAAAPRGVYRIDGIPQMRKRPMKGLIDALRSLGADIRCTGTEGFFPIEIHSKGLRGGDVSIDASESSQMLSALLMVAPRAARDITITLTTKVRAPFVAMTILQMVQFGQSRPVGDGVRVTVKSGARYHLPGSTYAIEADASAASYYLALPFVTGGELNIPGYALDGLQGDVRFGLLLEAHGLIGPLNHSTATQSISRGTSRTGINADFSEFSDTFLTLAAISPLLSGKTTITGIAHSRKQETDRVSGMARELIKLGQDVVETEDSLTITPRPLKSGVEIETYGDHRFAMSFGILGCHDLHGNGQPWLSIKDPACCAKTFPNFFELLETLRLNSLKPSSV